MMTSYWSEVCARHGSLSVLALKTEVAISIIGAVAFLQQLGRTDFVISNYYVFLLCHHY